jgi:hypothetical protein
MSTTARFLVVLLALAGGLTVARADVNSTLAKARAYLGTDAALDGIKSVRYTGTLQAVEGTAQDSKTVDVAIEIIFQKPFRHRTVAKFPNRIETTALDNFDAWLRIQDRANPAHWELRLMPKDQIKRLRANTWENLSFYRGLERRGGRVEDLGETTVNGIACQKIAFRHEPSIVFVRYFDKNSGRLVLTETEQGGSIREEGEMIVAGVRFPKRIVMTSKLADGKELAVPVTFDRIFVNETFPDDYFSVPQPR